MDYYEILRRVNLVGLGRALGNPAPADRHSEDPRPLDLRALTATAQPKAPAVELRWADQPLGA